MIRLGPEDRVLVRAPSWLGDFLMAEPFLRALFESRAEGARDPADLRISLAGPARFLELFEDRFPGVRRIPLTTATEVGPAIEPEVWKGHDVAIFLDGSTRSVWRAIRAGIPRRVGWARGGRRWLLTDAVSPARELGRVPLGLGRAGRFPRYLPRPFASVCHELASLLGVQLYDVRPRIEVAELQRAAVRARMERLGANPDAPYLVVNVGARAGSAKAYPPESWAQVLAALAASGDVSGSDLLFLTGGPGEEERVEQVAASVSKDLGARVRAVDPPPRLGELAAWCAGARLTLTADGGVRHVAAAVGSPRVVLFGPTDPRHTAEVWPDEQHVRVEVDCGPCHRERCPLNGPNAHRCMTELDPQNVVQAVSAALS